MKTNKNYRNLSESYLFATIGKKVNEYAAANPHKEIIRMGIGDVTLPLAPAVVRAMQNAAGEMGRAETFRGYGEYYGYDFLREAICGYYAGKGVTLGTDEIFVSDGAKSDAANILDIFDSGSLALIPDPVYPVYLDTNIMAGNKIIFAPGNVENDFLPMPDGTAQADIIYLCSPNNPTGAVYSKARLQEWVDFANACDAVILFDAAYEVFVRDDYPTSIYEIPGAESCAIEFGTLSKTAGFTGTRCAWAVIPKNLKRDGMRLNKMWQRRQATKFNAVPYIVQRGAEAAFSPEGYAQSMANVEYYAGNADIITKALTDAGRWYTGGRNSPYVWLKCPGGLSGWEFFDICLEKAGVVGTPGEGFGSQGQGFFRLSAFGGRENTITAMDKFKEVLSEF